MPWPRGCALLVGVLTARCVVGQEQAEQAATDVGSVGDVGATWRGSTDRFGLERPPAAGGSTGIEPGFDPTGGYSEGGVQATTAPPRLKEGATVVSPASRPLSAQAAPASSHKPKHALARFGVLEDVEEGFDKSMFWQRLADYLEVYTRPRLLPPTHHPLSSSSPNARPLLALPRCPPWASLHPTSCPRSRQRHGPKQARPPTHPTLRRHALARGAPILAAPATALMLLGRLARCPTAVLAATRR